MKNKKIIIMVLISIFIMGVLAGCGSKTNETQVEQSENKSQTEVVSDDSSKESTEDESVSDDLMKESNETEAINDESDPKDTEIQGESGKVLVVYYSASGNTEAVANTIAESMNADIFELEPLEPYSDDDLNWSDNNSRVSKEHDNPDSRTVELTSTTVDNWDAYDTVFIGYPIWWGIAAWPVDGFVKANDFTGKTVIPFCTASSSGIGESGELLAEMAGTGNWIDGDKFRSSASAEDIQAWIESLEE